MKGSVGPHGRNGVQPSGRKSIGSVCRRQPKFYPRITDSRTKTPVSWELRRCLEGILYLGQQATETLLSEAMNPSKSGDHDPTVRNLGRVVRLSVSTGIALTSRESTWNFRMECSQTGFRTYGIWFTMDCPIPVICTWRIRYPEISVQVSRLAACVSDGPSIAKISTERHKREWQSLHFNEYSPEGPARNERR